MEYFQRYNCVKSIITNECTYTNGNEYNNWTNMRFFSIIATRTAYKLLNATIRYAIYDL